MVDAPASHLGRLDKIEAATPVAGRPLSLAAQVVDAAAYASACRDSTFAPAQSPDWITAWLSNIQSDALIASVNEAGRTLFTIALEVQTAGPFKIARIVGCGHANGNFPPTARNLPRSQHQPLVTALVDQIARDRPDIDLLALERLAPDWHGQPNPLKALPHTPSPNIALAVNLSGGFDAVLSRSHGSKKRKKHRYQLRRLQAAGEIRRLTAQSPDEAKAMLDAFFEMKSGRLKRLGVANVFGDGHVQAFFHELFAKASTSQKPAFVLNALEVGGTLRAVTGSSRSGDRIICDFAAIADDDLTAASPGDYLFFENISAACRDSLAVYDFGVGDEPYKRSWCDIETDHFDVWMPMTTRGKLLAGALSAKARLKALVKHSPLAWRIWKVLRSRAGRSAE